jgi:glycosyltransferase involved in cell wall biosynthesis
MHGSNFDMFCRNSSLKSLLSFVLNQADAIIVLSSYWRNFFSKLTNTRLEIIPNCPRELFFKHDLRTDTGQSIVFTGSVGRRKGVDILLEAAEILRSRGLDNPVIVAGDDDGGGEISNFRRRAEQDGLTDVEFRGDVDAVGLVKLLSGAAVFCLPSRGEGLPIAMLEAMAMGVPVVATPVGGIPDALKEGVNGYIVPVGNPLQLADKLEKLLLDPGLRAGIGETNYHKARNDYHPRITAGALANLYNSLLD